MKFIFLLILTISFAALAQPTDTQTGSSPMGPATMGQSTYPNSGTTESRSTDVAGEDSSSATFENRQEAQNNLPTAASQKQEEQKKFDIGPYDKDGNYTIDVKERAEETD